MKTYNELINEVAAPQSPADKEFVALHRVRKYQAVNYPEHQFKGGTEKDHTKLTVPSNETGVETEVEKEKPRQLGEWREHRLDEAVEVDHSNYKFTHGKEPRGEGNWAFHNEKNGSLDSGFTHRGTYTAAKSAAKKWASSKGHTRIHVLT
jgi:hypothetical protein